MHCPSTTARPDIVARKRFLGFLTAGAVSRDCCLSEAKCLSLASAWPLESLLYLFTFVLVGIPCEGILLWGAGTFKCFPKKGTL